MKRTAALLAATLLSSPVRASDRAGEPVWIDEARVVELALADNPTVTVADEETRAAQLSQRAATLGLVPDVQITGRYTRLSNIDASQRSLNGFTFPQVLNQLGVRGVVSVPVSQLFLNLAANVRALGHASHARELELSGVRAAVAYEARVAFLRYWRAKLGLATALELQRASELQLEDQRARKEAGSVSPNDVLSFEVALDAAVLGEQSARKELSSAEAALRRFVPSTDQRELRVPELDAGSERMSDQAVPTAAQSPRVLALLAQAESARDAAKAASLERLPKLSVYAAGEYAAPNPRVFVATDLKFLPSWEAGLRLEWMLSQALSGGALAERARVRHRQLLARVEELRRQLAAERVSTLDALTISHERVERSGARVKRASALSEARRNELQAGTALPLNVIIAESDLARAKNEYVDAIVERALAHANLDYLDGRVAPSVSLGSAQ